MLISIRKRQDLGGNVLQVVSVSLVRLLSNRRRTPSRLMLNLRGFRFSWRWTDGSGWRSRRRRCLLLLYRVLALFLLAFLILARLLLLFLLPAFLLPVLILFPCHALWRNSCERRKAVFVFAVRETHVCLRWMVKEREECPPRVAWLPKPRRSRR